MGFFFFPAHNSSDKIPVATQHFLLVSLHSSKEQKRLQLKEISRRMVWDLFAQISLEKVNKTEEAKQLQAMLALHKLAQLLQVSIH